MSQMHKFILVWTEYVEMFSVQILIEIHNTTAKMTDK